MRNRNGSSWPMRWRRRWRTARPGHRRADRARRRARPRSGHAEFAGVELEANLVAVGMVDLAEDAPGMFPCLPGGALLARGVMDIAEVIERDSLVVPVGTLPAQVDGPLVAGDRLLMVV